MESFNRVLVVIPARGGSKRIPNKNIKSMLGQPMIYWPLMELSNFKCLMLFCDLLFEE